MDSSSPHRHQCAKLRLAFQLRLVEHPYRRIKHWMGSTHFSMKRLPNVQAKISLHVLAYNMKRAISVLGIAKIMEQLQVA